MNPFKSSIIPALLIAFICCGFTTYWTFDLFEPELRSSTFDSLGKSLMAGRADVENHTINWEGLQINGKTYIYQGPFPALLRIALNSIAPQHYGEWARVSTLLAMLIIAGTGGVIGWVIAGTRGATLLAIGLSLGSPALYLAANSRIYHESIIWGLAWSVVGIAGIVIAIATTAKRSGLVLLSIAFTFATLSRVTFGIPLALSMIILWLIAYQKWRLALGTLASLAIPALLGVLIQSWYNFARFGNALKFIDYSVFYIKPDTLGGEFNIKRVPEALTNYLLPQIGNLDSAPLFVRTATSTLWHPELFFGWQEQITPLLLCSPWLLFGTSISLFKSKKLPELRWFLLPFGLQVALILSYYFITQRYAAELIPFLLLGTIITLAGLQDSQKIIRVLWALVCLSTIATGISTLSWLASYASPGTDIPASYQRTLKQFFLPTTPLPVSVPADLKLTTLAPLDLTPPTNQPQLNQTHDGAPLTLDLEPISNGIGMHTPSSITFSIPEGIRTLLFTAAVADSAANCRKAEFQVAVVNESGEELFRSVVLGFNQSNPNRSAPRYELATVALKDSKRVTFVADPKGPNTCDHVVIAEPRFRP